MINTLIITCGVILAFWLLGFSHSGLSRDTTDNPNGSRSGFIILTDHATGVQYLAVFGAGMSVRVDRDGKPYSDVGARQ